MDPALVPSMRIAKTGFHRTPNVLNLANGAMKLANAVPFFGRFMTPMTSTAGMMQLGVGKLTGRDSLVNGGRDLAARSVAAAMFPLAGGVINVGGAIEDFSGMNAGEQTFDVDVTFTTKRSPRDFIEALAKSPSDTIGLIPTNVRDHGDGSFSGQPFPLFGPKVHTRPFDVEHRSDQESAVRLQWLDDGQVFGETLFVARIEDGQTVVRETGELTNATGWLPGDWVEGGHGLTLKIGYAGDRR